jgi:hypothetical protein
MDGDPRGGWYSAQQDAERGAFECLDERGRVVVVTLVLGLDEAPPTGWPDYRSVGRVVTFVRRIRWPLRAGAPS